MAGPKAKTKREVKKEESLSYCAEDVDEAGSDFELPMSDLASQLIAGAKKDERPDWAPNGKCYWLQLSPSNRATCKPCGNSIALGKVRFGSAAMERFHGSFMWRHTCCVTAQQLRNVADTYGTEDYAIIPGWGTTLDDQGRARIASEFDKAKRVGAKKEKEKQAKREEREAAKRAREERKERRERFLDAPGAWFDWRRLLASGELELEPAHFLAAVLEFLGLPGSGSKKQLVARLYERAGDGDVGEGKAGVKMEETAEAQGPKVELAEDKPSKKARKRKSRKAQVKKEEQIEEDPLLEGDSWGIGFEAPHHLHADVPRSDADLVMAKEEYPVEGLENEEEAGRRRGRKRKTNLPSEERPAKKKHMVKPVKHEKAGPTNAKAPVSRAERAARRSKAKS